MSKVVNPDFFKQRIRYEKTTEKSSSEVAVHKEHSRIAAPLKISTALTTELKKVSDTLEDFGCKKTAAEIQEICNRGLRNRFSIAVVGEFSRGKSTFINSLLGKDILPIGDLPTTALLTRIRYNSKERMIHFNGQNKKSAELPISQDSWDGLTADNFGKCDPTGTVLVGTDSAWLGENNIEIMDTPGAGDLEEKRARIIGDALLGSDGAIITVSATAALSMSEKLFIEQRLISRNTPFLMLIVTKLDLVKKEERVAVVDYIIKKLNSWNMNIPVFIPYEVETTEERFNDIMGIDKIKANILSWVNDPKRLQFTEDWIVGQAVSVIEREISALKEQKVMLDANDAKRNELIKEKKIKLNKAEIAWEELRLQMLRKCNKCYEQLLSKAQEYSISITERLQYEASHTNNPNKWWNEDYAYRLKVELANMAAGIENTVARIIADDTRWFNASLEHNFKTHILCEKETIYDKNIVANVAGTKALEFEDLDKKRTATRVGTTVLSIAGFAVCSSLGFLPIVATMGIGTASSIISEKIFKQKIEDQRETIKATIAKEVPRIIDEATAESEARLKAVYDDVLKSAVEKEKAWEEAQVTAIENSIKPQDPELKNTVNAQLEVLETFKKKLIEK